MGAYCPAPIVDDEMIEFIEEQIIIQTIHTMKRNRKPFRGLLYAGLMLTKAGPRLWNSMFVLVTPSANRSSCDCKATSSTFSRQRLTAD